MVVGSFTSRLFLILFSIASCFRHPLHLRLPSLASSRTAKSVVWRRISSTQASSDIATLAYPIHKMQLKLTNLSHNFSSISSPLEKAKALVDLGDKFSINMKQNNYLSLKMVKVEGCISIVKLGVLVEKSRDIIQNENRDKETVSKLNSYKGSSQVNNIKTEAIDYEDWIIHRIYGESDSRVTNGLLALLSESLQGCCVNEVFGLVDGNSIIESVGLKDVLSQGRISGTESIIKALSLELRAEVTRQCINGQVNISSSLGLDMGQDQNISVQNLAYLDIDSSNPSTLTAAASYGAEEVAVLLSGGVDSSVALRLALDQGYKVKAYYLKIWLEDELAHLNECPWTEDLSYASAVANQHKVSLEAIPMQQDYFDLVTKEAIREVEAGRTPNPDILCNSRIKFGMFYDQVGKHFNKVITGHYAKTRLAVGEMNGQTLTQLERSVDRWKDQTYFLSRLSQSQVSKAYFPLGDYTKAQVRSLARDFDLPTQNRKDSQGLCFLGKLKWNDFIGHYLKDKPGDICEYETGRVLGKHRGLHYHTIGQRKGLGQLLTSEVHNGPWFVYLKKLKENVLYVSNRQEHSSLLNPNSPTTKSKDVTAQYEQQQCQMFDVEDVQWIAHEPKELSQEGCIGKEMRLSVQVRHGPNTCEATVRRLKDDLNSVFRVTLDFPDNALAPGQYAAFYSGNVCLGSGIISKQQTTFS